MLTLSWERASRARDDKRARAKEAIMKQEKAMLRRLSYLLSMFVLERTEKKQSTRPKIAVPLTEGENYSGQVGT